MDYVLCNKVSSLKVDDKYLTLFDLCCMILERIPKDGISISEMKVDLELSEKIFGKKEDEEISVTTNEIKRLKTLIDSTKFPFRHVAFIQFSEFINDLHNKLML